MWSAGIPTAGELESWPVFVPGRAQCVTFVWLSYTRLSPALQTLRTWAVPNAVSPTETNKQQGGLSQDCHPPGDPHLIYVYIHKCISSGKELLEAFHTSVCSEGRGASPVLTLQAVLTSPRLGEADQMPPLEHISQLYCCLEFLMIFANSI